MDCFVVIYANKLLVRHQWFACVLYCVKSVVFKLREIVQPILLYSLLIRLLRFEIAFNAGVFFFFSFGGSRKQFLLTESKRRLRSRLLLWLVKLWSCFLFYLQGLINMKLYDKQLYANLEDLTVWAKSIRSPECRGHQFLMILYLFSGDQLLKRHSSLNKVNYYSFKIFLRSDWLKANA